MEQLSSCSSSPRKKGANCFLSPEIIVFFQLKFHLFPKLTWTHFSLICDWLLRSKRLPSSKVQHRKGSSENSNFWGTCIWSFNFFAYFIKKKADTINYNYASYNKKYIWYIFSVNNKFKIAGTPSNCLQNANTQTYFSWGLHL